MDGYLFFDPLGGDRAEALLGLVDDGLLRVAGRTVSGSAAAFAAYAADTVEAADRTIRTVTDRVGAPCACYVALVGRAPEPTPGPPEPLPLAAVAGWLPPPVYLLDKPRLFGLALLTVGPGRELALARRAADLGAAGGVVGAAVVIGGPAGVILEVGAGDEAGLAAAVAAVRALGDLERVDVLLTGPAIIRVGAATRGA